MELQKHTGHFLKALIRDYGLADQKIVSTTRFDQVYLSKLYTSSQIEPKKLYNFLFVLNRHFNLGIEPKKLLV